MLSQESPGWASCPFGHRSTGCGWRLADPSSARRQRRDGSKRKSFQKSPNFLSPKHPFLKLSTGKRVSAHLPYREEDVFRTLTHSPFHLLKRVNLPVSSATSRSTVVCALWSTHKDVATTPVKDRGVKAHSHHQNETCCHGKKSKAANVSARKRGRGKKAGQEPAQGHHLTGRGAEWLSLPILPGHGAHRV